MTRLRPIYATPLAWALAAIFALALAGCGSTNGAGGSAGGNAMPASAADPQTVQNVREKYRRAYPQSQVGVVIATLAGEPFVAVGDLSAVSDLRESEVVTFLDRNERVLTTGTIVRILPDSIHVRVDDPPRNGRAPRRGDIAVVRTPFGGAI